MKITMKSHRKTVALSAIAAAVLVALTALAVTMAGTTASTEDTNVVLKCESGIPDMYTIETGHTASSTVVGLNEAFSGDAGIASVVSTGDKLSNLKITGKKAGVATIAHGTDLGMITVIRYQITDSRNISSYTIKEGGAVRLGNPGDTSPVPVEVVSGTDNIKWRSLNETVASVDPNTGLVTAVKKGVTILVGEFTDKWGVDRDIHILAGVGVSLDGIDGGTGGGDVNYVEDPEGSNIWKPVDSNGNVTGQNAIWGGNDGKPGGGDDRPIHMFGGQWWVDMSQNVWEKYIGKTTLGPPTGGGPDRDPTTEPVTGIFDNTANDGKYYVGPLGSGEDEYYYGDKMCGDGYLDSTADMSHGDDVKYYMDADGNMTTLKPVKPITTTGSASLVDGRILDDAQTGDGDWVEIARNGDYSLIIRKDFIKCYQDQNQTDYWNWYAPQVTGDDYGAPNNFLRQEINKWFNMEINGNADGRQVLAKDARLRNYTVQNNAYSTLGSSGKYPASMTEGFSKPTSYQTGEGNDVAFALSWSEAASFCSASSRYRDEGTPMVYSDPVAAANYGKLSNLHYIYLRSIGDISGMMATIFGGGSEPQGQVFQSGKAYIHPALWVHGSIFD